MRSSFRRVLAIVLVSLVAGVFVAPAYLGGPTRVGAASLDFSLVTSPPLDPSFNPAILNYAIRCTGSPTTSLTTSGSGSVTVGATTFPGPVSLALPLVAGQDVQVTNGGTTYSIRCLPGDFPNYTSTVTGQPQQANGYLLTVGQYAVVFDLDGVPVWWDKDTAGFSPWDAKFLDDSTIAWSENDNQYTLRGLDGTNKGTVGGGSVPLDFHDLQRLPNGNYLGIMDVTRNCPADPTQCVDLSSWGLSSQATIIDNLIVELTPDNQIVWSWSVADHVNVAAANVNWHDQFPDVIHMNSILYDGNGGIIWSARHLDAVYRIDMATGALTWKLGGSPEPESLNVVGDQYVDAGGQLFSGQHYARLAPDGSLTVSDNGTRANRGPRAVRFTIDTSTNTATEVEQVTDPRATYALCCGSVEKLAGGDWVASWGYNDFMTELNPQGVPQITITYPSGLAAPYFSYREADVPVSVDTLSQGMDAMVAPLTDVPSSSVLWPSPNATLAGNQYLDAGASDPVGVTNVEFQLTGGLINNAVIATAAPTAYGWIAGWNTSTVPNGTYSLQSVAYNTAGSVDYGTPVTVTVANGPATSILLPASGSILTGAQLVDAAASDAGGVSGVQFELTGGALNQSVIATAAPTAYGWIADWNTTTVPDGVYTLQSVATDSANLSTVSAGVSVTVANPTVSTISPTSGPGGGGTKVIITGTRLTGATKVLFGTVPAASYTVNSATKIVAYSPPESAGTVDVSVTESGATTALVAADRFTFLAPTVSKISPTKGPVAGGTQVIITGTNFTGATSVTFGLAAAEFTVSSPTKILAIAPPEGAGTVNVVVTTPGGPSAPVVTDGFTYH